MKEIANRRALLKGGLAILFAGSSHGALADAVWQNWGYAPYADNDAEAFSDKKLDFFLASSPIPVEGRAGAKKMLLAFKQGQSIDYLDPTDTLDIMMSGPGKTHKEDYAMVKVQVGTRLISRGVVAAAKARLWKYEFGGLVFWIWLPDICHNWAMKVVVVGVKEECVYIHFPTEDGDLVKFAIIGPEALEAGHCLGLKRANDDKYRALPTQCLAFQEHWCNRAIECHWEVVIKSIREQTGWNDISELHSGGYPASGGVNILRLPPIVVAPGSHYAVAFCIVRGNKITKGKVVIRTDYLETGPRRSIIFELKDQVPDRYPDSYDLYYEWVDLPAHC